MSATWGRIVVAIRSFGVGGVATAVDMGALALLVTGAGLTPQAASLPALALGIGIQFFGNKIFAFRDRRPYWIEQGAQFLAVEALGFVANWVLFAVMVTHTKVPYLLVRLGTTSAVYFCVCLPLWSKIFSARTIGEHAP